MKYAAVVSYDGSSYNGFQRQKETKSVQGELERFLTFFLGKETTVKGAGRTDKGVHALGQVISFESPRKLDGGHFLKEADSLLPPSISIKSIREVDPAFDARHSSVAKVYLYRFRLGRSDPFSARYVYFPGFKMDLDVLRATLETYLGEHNFRCFTGKEADVDGYRRTIKSVSLGEEGGEYRIELKATGFMRYMVRMMLGVAFRVAAGKLTPDYIAARFRDPSLGPVPYMAPAEGLYLKEVLYK